MTMATPEKPVIIIGAGVVGLTLAHGLANVCSRPRAMTSTRELSTDSSPVQHPL